MLNILPSRKEFIKQTAKSGRMSTVYAELPFMPPRQVFGSVEAPDSFLFESIKGPGKIARYSFIGADPFMIFRAKNGVVEITAGDKKFKSLAHPLKRLKELMSVYPVSARKEIPPFAGGAAGIISYDFVHYLEKLPRTTIDDLDIPDAHFMLVDTVAAFDHKLRKTFLISCPAAGEIVTGYEKPAGDRGVYYDDACEKINRLYKKITSGDFCYPPSTGGRRPGGGAIEIRHEMG